MGPYIRSRLNSNWIVLVLTGLIFLTGTVIFWRALTLDERNKIDETTVSETDMISRHVASEIQEHFRVLGRMAERWEFSGRTSESAWQQASELNVSDFPGFRSIQWIGSTYEVRRAAPFALAEEAMAYDHTAVPQLREALDLARRNDTMIATGPLDLLQGDRGFIAYQPVYVNVNAASPDVIHTDENFDGFFLGTFAMKDLFDVVLADPAFNGYGIAIFSGDEEIHAVSQDERMHERERGADQEFSLAGRDWQVRVWPEQSELSEQQSGLPLVALAGGLLLTVLMLFLVRLLQVARHRTREALAVNADLKASSLALAESHRSLEEFAYIASHDLKTPLLSLQGMVNLLVEDFGDRMQPEARMYVDRISANASKMRSLLNDMLKISLLLKLDEPMAPVDLNRVVQSVTDDLSQTLVARGATVSVVDTLPAVQGNEMWLQQIFSNLIDNSVRYTPEHRIPSIEIGWRDRSDMWEIFVRDNGSGIPKEFRGSVFGMFKRLPPGIASHPDGSGMGLAIVARAVNSHGGTIWIDTTSDGGTTFVFTLARSTTNNTSGHPARRAVPTGVSS